MSVYGLIAIVLGMLILERLCVIGACKSPSGRHFIKKCTLFHPNAISLMRVPMGIISITAAYYGHWTFATLWFAFWMITDLSDGTIARYCDLNSETGKWLDPFSDKCMTIPPLLYFCTSQTVCIQLQNYPVLAYILVDIIGQSSRLFVKKKAANLFGKAKTAMITLLLTLLAFNEIDQLSFLNQNLVDAIMYCCLILACLSTYCKIIPDIWYANTLTLANFLCGIIAIIYALQCHYVQSLVSVFIGQFFDLFDGRLARKFGSTKRGALFDDIADATSFGFGIGTMIFNCLRQGNGLIPTSFVLIVSIFYVGCLIYRLYRFMKPTQPMPKGIFQGLPSPAGAMMSGSAVMLAVDLNSQIMNAIATFFVILSSCLMISNIPYCHFGQTIWPGISKFKKLLLGILFSLLAAGAIAQKTYRSSFTWCCFGFSLLYLIYGIHSVNKLPPAGTSKAEE